MENGRKDEDLFAVFSSLSLSLSLSRRRYFTKAAAYLSLSLSPLPFQSPRISSTSAPNSCVSTSADAKARSLAATAAEL